MNRLTPVGCRKRFAYNLLLWLTYCFGFGVAPAEPVESTLPSVTNIFQLRSAVTLQSGRICAYDLEGIILVVNSNSGALFFQDNSGTVVLELGLKGLELRPGQRVRLRGTNYVAYTYMGLSLGARPVIDADNLHSTIERSGELYLKAGYHPIRVVWFNQSGAYALNLAYAGPQITKQTIPTSTLFRTASTAEDGNVKPGLSYRFFEGDWERLPDFNSLVPQKIGNVSNFNVSVATRIDNAGLEFNGFLKLTNEGNYTFYLSSDDGAQMFLDDTSPEVSIIGTAPVPVPQPIAVSQPLSDGIDNPWARSEGTITYLSRHQNSVRFELTFGENQMQVEVLNTAGNVPWYLLNSRVRVTGILPDIKSIVGQKYAGLMIVAGWQDVSVLDVMPEQWSSFNKTTIGELSRRVAAGSNNIVCLQGRFHTDPATQALRFEDATGSATVQLLNALSVETNLDMDCLCQWSWQGTNLFLNEAIARESLHGPDKKINVARVLTTAMEVQRLTRDEAAHEYPVKIHGVITSVAPDFRSLLIQDFTRAVFVWTGDASPASLPQVGDYCELDGITRPADFSPIVLFSKAIVLWQGRMPQPIRPTRDQLISGSLDAQYVEIRGLIIGTHDTYMTLLTADGMLDLDVLSAPGEQWKSLLNSIVRVRGCLVANWNPTTHSVIIDSEVHLNIWNATFSVDSPPPIDPFAPDQVRAKDLMQFDVRFDTFRRVKVSGQIIHCSPDMDYLMDGQTGLRFQLAKPASFNPGDEVEVVGLVELGGASPILRQAIARKTGYRLLPDPRDFSINSLSNNYDSTLVSVNGTLVDIQNHGTQQTLELQVGMKSFIARLDYHKQRLPSAWLLGSRLKLTGTFSALDGDRLAGRDVNSFELLLNTPDDVEVIARPAWWTLRRLLVVTTGLLAGLTLAFAWIGLLRRQVERRTHQLRNEIGERERTEKLRAIELERARIARDLHDDLGSALTEISMMAMPRPGLNGLKTGSEIAAERLREIAEKSRSMVSALDGVVWVINPKNDTLSSLVEYLASYAEEFLGKAQVACRVELPQDYVERVIASEIRHEVMLVVREVFNNAVRHGRPNEVLLRLIIARENLEILIQDDGCGFNPIQARGNGLGNLKQRMSKLNGSCQIESTSGSGTSITLKLVLPK